MKSFGPLFLLPVLALMTPSLQAATQPHPEPNYVLIVDDSNPSDVTFTVTGSASTVADVTHLFSDGIDLVAFLKGAGTTSALSLAPTMSTSNAASDYDSARSDDLSAGTDTRDLDIFDATAGTPSAVESFSTTASAFTGTISFDFAGTNFNTGLLPAAGIKGDIYAGYSGDAANASIVNDPSVFHFFPLINGFDMIGQYEVVPEPSQWSLLLLGGVALVAFRRFRSRSA